MGVFVIAEAGSSWDCDESKAFRLIEAAKACGADACKFQWTSNAKAMAERRLGENAAQSIEMYKRYLEYPLDVLTRLKAHCDSVGIEFLCTVYIPEDIEVIKPLVKRYKISAFESQDASFIAKHLYPWDKTKEAVIISLNPGKAVPMHLDAASCVKTLYCISLYPAPLETLKLGDHMIRHDGFSDHTANVLTGAAAVAAGATIVEVHCRLHSTEKDNPDYGHSLIADRSDKGCWDCPEDSHREDHLREYIGNIRTVERML